MVVHVEGGGLGKGARASRLQAYSQQHAAQPAALPRRRALLTDVICGAAATSAACCRFDTKADVFYYIGVTGSKSADAGAFKLNIDNTAAAT